VLGEDAHARVALFLGVVKVAFQTSQGVERAFHVWRLGFDFLDANTIRLGFFEPSFHALAGGRTNAVEVEAG